MFNAIAIAKVFGPLLIIMGVWNFLYQENTRKIAEAFKKNLAAYYVGGVINLIIGLTIINGASHWSVHLTVLVTILGWVIFLKGLLFFIFPALFKKMANSGKNFYLLCSFISIAWGATLVWLACTKP